MCLRCCSVCIACSLLCVLFADALYLLCFMWFDAWCEMRVVRRLLSVVCWLLLVVNCSVFVV